MCAVYCIVNRQAGRGDMCLFSVECGYVLRSIRMMCVVFFHDIFTRTLSVVFVVVNGSLCVHCMDSFGLNLRCILD